MTDLAALQEPPTDHDDRVRLAAAIAAEFAALRAAVQEWTLPPPPAGLFRRPVRSPRLLPARQGRSG